LNSNLPSADLNGLDPAKLPTHIAVIMDGNGRWAKRRLLNRVKGHEKGADTVRTVVRTCREIGIQFLTLYAFSTENWQRPKAEVSALMTLLKKYIVSEKTELHQQNIRLNVLGEMASLPEDVRTALNDILSLTRDNAAMTLNLALNYGGRTEIVKMVREIALEVQAGRLDPGAIDAEVVARHLYTGGMPDPDLLIRTSGELRISNFLLWQIAYAEIFVTPTLWPDFNREEFVAILRQYQRRERRFGKLPETQPSP
jgi:undecaprenyl diphosphate synthase